MAKIVKGGFVSQSRVAYLVVFVNSATAGEDKSL